MQEIVYLRQNSMFKAIVMALSIGWDIFGILLICVLIGAGIDYIFSLKPIGILGGCFFGIVGSFVQILKIGGK